MNQFFAEALREVHDTYFPEGSEASANQASDNTFSVALPAAERIGLSQQDVVEFLNRCYELAAARIREPSRFYAWLDGLAGQLRFSVVADGPQGLPFRIAVREVSVEDLAKGYIGEYIETGTDVDEGHLWVWTRTASPAPAS